MLPPRQDSSSSSSHYLSPSVFDFTPKSDFASLSDYSELPDDSFMSGQPFHFQDPFYWSQQAPQFGQPHLFSEHPDNSFDLRQHNASIPARDWQQLYADGAFNANALGQTAQSKIGHHRRALSNSTIASHASTSSPRQNSVAYDNAFLDPNAYSTYQSHHYPTPTQTPTQDSFMDQANPRQNRISAAQRAMKNAAVAEHNNQQTLSANQPAQYYAADYPATPKTSNGDYNDRQPANVASFGEIEPVNSAAWVHNDSLLFDDFLAMRRIPDLSRTMSDIYQDELYDPSSATIPAQPQQVNSASLLSPHRTVMNNRLQAANDARSSHSPVDLKRENSPFRPNSPYASTTQAYGPIHGSGVATAAAQRQQQKAEADARAFRQHHMRPDDSAPKTISPQEAYLDHFHDPAEDSVGGPALFPQHSSSQQQLFDNNVNRLAFGPLNDGRQMSASAFNFQSTPVPSLSHAPSSGSFKFSSSQHRSSGDSNDEAPPDFPAHLISMETSKSEADPESSQEADVARPTDTSADGGTYTCTYQNCTRRFATPALLQKHKREGHRSTAGSSVKAEPGSPKDSATSSASPGANTQAGPHRCDRINPSTGKPCNTIFSRPYDLTRHEDTIHARRGKVQCQYCTEEKTFSRADALTRHMRVVHPTIDFPGKHRRRHMD